jgi:hypothetical protein
MIASFIDGRIRIRAEVLKRPEAMAMARSLIEGSAGVLKVESNARTGSILVRYDPAVITPEMLTGAAALMQAQFGAAPRAQKTGRPGRLPGPNAEMFLLTLSYGGMLAGTVLGKRVHIAFGVLFSLLTGIHVYARLKKGIRS